MAANTVKECFMLIGGTETAAEIKHGIIISHRQIFQ